MLKNYKLTFTQDRETYKTMVVPANNLTEAYIELQMRIPDAEISEATEGSSVTDTWVQVIAKYMIAKGTLNDACDFVGYLDDQKHDEFINALWGEWHKRCVS